MAQVQVPQQQAAAVVSAGPAVSQFPTTSLYIGDLEANVTDAQLFDMFSQVGHVVSVRVCRDISTRRSLGYAYVNYGNPVDATRALEVLNFTPLNNKPIRIMFSNRDPSTRRSGAANIFIKNLDKAIDNKALYDTFSAFGNILSCKVATDSSGQSKGYGFVQFDQEEAAKSAIDRLDGMLMNDKKVYVGQFLRKQERENSVDKLKFNNVFVKNLSESTTEDDLQKILCFGFVNFVNSDDAARAVQELNGKKFEEKEWYVGKAQKKSERERELKSRFEQNIKEVVDKYQGLNLYLKNLDDSITDEKLRELFSEFGTITSCKVMRDPNGISRGSGFVAFSTAEEASRALSEMNGKMVGSKPLYVAHAQRKEDRKARLQAQFAQMRPVAIPSSVAPRMPIYPAGAPGIGQQLFYGQAPPALIPPQAGFGYQQQLIPGMRTGTAPMPNFYMPFVQQGQPGHRPGGRRAGGGPVQQTQQPMPLGQQQANWGKNYLSSIKACILYVAYLQLAPIISAPIVMFPRGGRVYRYPGGRNMPESPMTGGGMMYDMGGLPVRDGGISQSIPIGALASALANANPDMQRTMLGESLYPLVEQLERDHAAKVTGMLLEMDQTEVLHLLESPDALKAKVAEAMEVLRNVAQQQANTASDQLAGMSLNDGIIS
ncbi:Polyadenylate-binding protein (RRM superfamily) protein [Dioscorea alata]|uniref:Polyadenylate-binding protein (RRM superfamily) protein n=1 Tax=Dioscorea alata TaxID=55571 RepID=A0ACB7VDV5_DIOAL|nr:Polyadenylate-binding protein (RRM superfamily) protein [Dioscorea alata]